MKNKLVLIEWYDAQGNSNWDSTEDALKWSEKPLIVTEVGWVLQETKECLIIASQVSSDDDIGNRTKIPKPWIKSKKVLTVK